MDAYKEFCDFDDPNDDNWDVWRNYFINYYLYFPILTVTYF